MNLLDKYQNLILDGIETYKFSRHPLELYDPINYIISHNGKKIRPLLVLMACDMLGGNVKNAIKPALAIEFFHNFSLMHDDIMDGATLRRGKPSVHSVYGTNNTILSGDALLIKSYQFFEDLDEALFKKCIKIFSETAIQLCEGQQMDINFENTSVVSFRDYLRMITGKTGVLTASALKIGAFIAGKDNETANLMYNFGLNLGIAFQMMDDYLDIFGKEERFGKKHAGDIFENKKTILYLMALKFANEEERKELNFWYSKKTDNIDKVYGVEKIFRRTKVDEKVQDLIRRYNEKSLKYITKVDISNDKKKNFIEFAEYLLKRKF